MRMFCYGGPRSRCTKRSRWYVAYFQDGGGSLTACNEHLSHAVEHVSSAGTAKQRTVRVTPINRDRK